MSKTFVYDRFDINKYDSNETIPASDGLYVHADDAINREAVLQAEIRTLQVQLKDAKGPQWISVDDRLPECRLECTSSGTDVSNTVYMLGDSIGGSPGYGIGHLQSDSKWVCYDGEHDFMCITCVTHWMLLPAAPMEPA